MILGFTNVFSLFLLCSVLLTEILPASSFAARQPLNKLGRFKTSLAASANDVADSVTRVNPNKNRTSPTKVLHTSAILRISYDGSRFTGWTSGNQNGGEKVFVQKRMSKKQRRRGLAGEVPLPKGFVRSVERVIRDNLAKIYGNVDPNRVIVEGCSRTDRGVHAEGMMAQVYCLQDGVLERLQEEENDNCGTDNEERIHRSIAGKRLPHPRSPTDDAYFDPLPMEGNLSRLAFALNRMRPADVQITGVSPVPYDSQSGTVFHPTLSAVSKTYEYRISTGAFADPTSRRMTWYVGTEPLNLQSMKEACQRLQGGSRDFAAFQGAPRGMDDKRKRQQQKETTGATFCKLNAVLIEEEEPPVDPFFPGVTPPIQSYKVTIEGDRFLYKMVRFLVGSLVAIGKGELQLEDLQTALDYGHWEGVDAEQLHDTASKSPDKPFACAPAFGLVLAKVDYGELDFDWQSLRY